MEPDSSLPRWQPTPLAFRPYVPESNKRVQIPARIPVIGRLTKDISETYRKCNPKFNFSPETNPKRFLTTPSTGVFNDGHDNANSDLILTVNYTLVNSKSQRYVVKDLLGHGTFGQVAKCWAPERNAFVAVKIIKNQPAYNQQALVEVSILATLNHKYDPEDSHHIVRIFDHFVHLQHLCICFELLDINLFELIKINKFRGLTMNIVQLFSKQILRGMTLLKEAGIIHCDLKPENILLRPSVKPAAIKIIDFGSACMEDRTIYSYIQSRYYRSPEVLLGYQYTTAIDMWSVGCIVAELFLGLPLFPGASEFDLLTRMIEILGKQPPDYLLKEGKSTSKFFKCVGSIHNLDSECGRSAFKPLSAEEYEARDSKKPLIGKEYFKGMNLEAIVKTYPYRKNLPPEDFKRESEARSALIDFLRGLVEFDPAKRWSPFQASKHPFVTGEPFTSPFIPPPEISRIPVARNITIDHHPGGGHWFAAGLSPNVPGRSRMAMHNASHFLSPQYPPANSYGSFGSRGSFTDNTGLGSRGSFTDNTGLGSSYGSYGDGGNFLGYYSPAAPSAMYMHPLAQGGVPRRMSHYGYGSSIGMSPSQFAPLPLGTSPSQFTPPSHYGPPSPRGSPLGKFSSSSPFHRRKTWGYSPNSQFQESPSTSHQFPEPPPLNHNHNHNHSHSALGASPLNNRRWSSSQTVSHLPDPADWDPNYSDDLLLQESPDLSAEFGRAVHIDSSSSHASFTHQTNRSSNSFSQRPFQNPLQVDVGGPQFIPHPPRVIHGRGQLSPGSGSHNSIPWGRRTSYSSTSIPPAPHRRKDYEGIHR